MAITSCNNGITIGICGNVNNRKSAICFDIAFRAVCFDFNQFFLCILFATARIDIFNKNLVFIHIGISLLFFSVDMDWIPYTSQTVAIPMKYHFSL